MMLKALLAAGVEKVRSFSDEEAADYLLENLTPERIAGIMAILNKKLDIPSHSELVRRIRASRTVEELDAAVEWCNSTFHQVIERTPDGPWIVMKMTSSDSSEEQRVKLDVFAITFIDWIVPLFTIEQNVERMISHDEDRHLGYADWLREKLAEGVLGRSDYRAHQSDIAYPESVKKKIKEGSIYDDRNGTARPGPGHCHESARPAAGKTISRSDEDV